jgi:hypothetical protein
MRYQDGLDAIWEIAARIPGRASGWAMRRRDTAVKWSRREFVCIGAAKRTLPPPTLDVKQLRAMLGEFGQQLNHVEVVEQTVDQGHDRVQDAVHAVSRSQSRPSAADAVRSGEA